MIPKIIHYCWFGGKPLPELAQKCISSWKKYCPDYEIKEWNESNFDLNSCDYVREAYEAKKWAFITDYVRLYAMVTEGGIYMDTDVEVIKTLDPFLCHKAFSGFEDEVSIPTGIIACEKNFPLFTKLLEDYDNRHFILQDGKFDLTTNVVTITNLCKKYGFIGDDSRQDICGFILYPHDVFCPKSHVTGIISLTNRTVTIHHFSGSWKNKEAKISIQIKRKLDNKGPAFHIIAKVVAFPFTYSDRAKNEGVGKATHYYIRKIVKKIIIQKRGRNHI